MVVKRSHVFPRRRSNTITAVNLAIAGIHNPAIAVAKITGYGREGYSLGKWASLIGRAKRLMSGWTHPPKEGATEDACTNA